MWRSININLQNIKAETDKATLIACPHNSRYDGYCFWHTNKLVRNGTQKNSISISYTEEFDFKLMKYKGKEVVDEVAVDYEEIEYIFRHMNTKKNDFETHKPKQLVAENIGALEELRDE